MKPLIKIKKVSAIFFDISKAFDKVWHNGILFKMVEIGVPYHIVKWIKDYLHARSFCVKINAAKSTFRNIHTGVPQGSVLSPTLFSIFINDISIKNEKYSKSCMFADDLSTFYASSPEKYVDMKLSKYLIEFENWLKN